MVYILMETKGNNMSKDYQENGYTFTDPVQKVSTPMECPNVSSDILKYLDIVFPHTNPIPSKTLSEVFYAAGQRNVIDFLKEKRKIQLEIDR